MARERLRAAENEYKRRVDEARGELQRARHAYDQRISAARKDLSAKKKSYESRVRNAERVLEDARTGTKLAEYGAVRLYDNRLEASSRTVELSSAVRATVEVTGVRTDKVDNREVLLLLDTPEFDEVVKCRPDDATRVHQVAAAINTAAKQAQSHVAEHDRREQDAAAAFDAARADNRSLEEADATLARAQVDTTSIDAADRALAAAIADSSEVDSARYALLELDPGAKVRSVDSLSIARGSPLGWWRRKRKVVKIGLVGVAVLVALGAIGAVAGDGGDGPGDVSSDEVESPAKPAMVALSVTRPVADVVRTPSVEVRGFATPGAVVRVNGSTARRQGSRFTIKMRLKVGENRLVIRALKPGLKGSRTLVAVTRSLPPVGLNIRGPHEGRTVESAIAAIRGRASAGSTITVNGDIAATADPEFSLSIPVSQGANVITIGASKKGHEGEEIRLTVTRKLSDVERAAIAEQRRQDFINSAVTILYNQLIKNPDAYAGQRVKYYGEILQIQDAGGAGIMLLYVTDLGYDIWSDQIWVNYTGTVRGAAGSKLTVYGTVVGTKSYETQVGGETYVPEVDAVYISE